MKKGVVVLGGLTVLIVLMTSCSHSSGRNRSYSRGNEQLPVETTITIIGKPETEDSESLDVKNSGDSAFIICRPAKLSHLSELYLNRKSYIVSYNQNAKIPNWVSWHLSAEHTYGEIDRFGGYWEDEEVPKPRATKEDYKGSEWSHGHMCPAGDNKWDSVAMRETFLLTNICPQHRNLNSGLWNKIEQDCRKWAKRYGDLYIVCGPVLYDKEHETIGANKIVVPEAFFKVILCLQGHPKAIGFVIKNIEETGDQKGKKKKTAHYVNTVDDVERITGIDFFPALPDDIENEVEAHANLDDWR